MERIEMKRWKRKGRNIKELKGKDKNRKCRHKQLNKRRKERLKKVIEVNRKIERKKHNDERVKGNGKYLESKK